jgi:antitoxin MazE
MRGETIRRDAELTLDREQPRRVLIVYPGRWWGMQTKIQKWGNSLGLRIPRSFAAEAQVEEGAAVDLSVENGRLLVRPLRVRKYALNALLRKVSRRNLHGEISTGRAVGREAW